MNSQRLQKDSESLFYYLSDDKHSVDTGLH